MFIKDWFDSLLSWREKHIKEKNFILFISFLVGICTAIAAIILKETIHLIQRFLTERMDVDNANYLYLIYPVIGILISGLFVKYILCHKRG